MIREVLSILGPSLAFLAIGFVSWILPFEVHPLRSHRYSWVRRWTLDKTYRAEAHRFSVRLLSVLMMLGGVCGIFYALGKVHYELF